MKKKEFSKKQQQEAVIQSYGVTLEKQRRTYLGYLQEDLKNERMHCLFYQQAAAMVKGLHREEFRELFLKEANSELHHIDEFATLIVQLGGVPGTEVATLPIPLCENPDELCTQACQIEQIVAGNYALRMNQTNSKNDDMSTYVNLFYEDQLTDSKKAAMEFDLTTNFQTRMGSFNHLRRISDEKLSLLKDDYAN